MVTPNFQFGYQEHLLGSAFSVRKNFPVLVSTTDKKPEYPKMPRTYAHSVHRFPRTYWKT